MFQNHCYGPPPTLSLGIIQQVWPFFLSFLSGMENWTCYRIFDFKRLWLLWSWITWSGKIQFYISFHVGYLAPDLYLWFIALIFFEVAFWVENILLKSALMNSRCGFKQEIPTPKQRQTLDKRQTSVWGRISFLVSLLLFHYHWFEIGFPSKVSIRDYMT